MSTDNDQEVFVYTDRDGIPHSATTTHQVHTAAALAAAALAAAPTIRERANLLHQVFGNPEGTPRDDMHIALHYALLDRIDTLNPPPLTYDDETLAAAARWATALAAHAPQPGAVDQLMAAYRAETGPNHGAAAHAALHLIAHHLLPAFSNSPDIVERLHADHHQQQHHLHCPACPRGD